MKVMSAVVLTVGLAAAAYAQQSNVAVVRGQSRFESTRPVPVPTAPLPPVAPAVQELSTPRYGVFPTARLPTATYRWGLASSGENKQTAKAAHEVDVAVEKLKRATSEEDKQAAEDLAKEKLGELFDLKTESREREISDLEKRLAEMRDQLEKRIDAKGQIVRLRLQTVVNEANGLTF